LIDHLVRPSKLRVFDGLADVDRLNDVMSDRVELEVTPRALESHCGDRRHEGVFVARVPFGGVESFDDHASGVEALHREDVRLPAAELR
jgi:hypothetical protein